VGFVSQIAGIDPRTTAIPDDQHAAWAWLILTVIVVGYVVAFDVWAKVTHHYLMTDQFRLWLFNPYTGPFIMAGWIGLFAGLTYHWFLKRG
jgi:hypothetical protein